MTELTTRYLSSGSRLSTAYLACTFEWRNASPIKRLFQCQVMSYLTRPDYPTEFYIRTLHDDWERPLIDVCSPWQLIEDLAAWQLPMPKTLTIKQGKLFYRTSPATRYRAQHLIRLEDLGVIEQVEFPVLREQAVVQYLASLHYGWYLLSKQWLPNNSPSYELKWHLAGGIRWS